MTVTEARKIVEELDDGRKFTDDEEFMFIEAMNFLIEEEKNPAATVVTMPKKPEYEQMVLPFA